MEIIVDECIAKSTRLILKEWGFEIINVEDILYSGVDDEKIFENSANRQVPIITHDRRFGLLYYHSRSKSSTIIVLQVLSPHPEATNQLLKKVLALINVNQPKNFGKLILISKNTIRIRSKQTID